MLEQPRFQAPFLCLHPPSDDTPPGTWEVAQLSRYLLRRQARYRKERNLSQLKTDSLAVAFIAIGLVLIGLGCVGLIVFYALTAS